MKAKSTFLASSLVVLALATASVFTFSACHSSDNEPSADDILSTETTPVEFQILGEAYGNQYTMFDYAGSSYIGSDSVYSKSSCTTNLRQGKHHIIWFYGVSHERVRRDWFQYPDYTEKYNDGIHFDPVEKTLTNYEESSATDILYCEQDFEVPPYLLPAQQVMFNKTATSSIQVIITDAVQNIKIQEQIPVHEVEDLLYSQPAGTIDGYPYVRMVSLVKNDSKVEKNLNFTLWAQVRYSKYFDEIKYDVASVYVSDVNVLCPLNGLDNIQLSADVKDRDGKSIPTTQLPKCSIRRNCKTVLTGPLFSGSTSDWTVTVEPYD